MSSDSVDRQTSRVVRHYLVTGHTGFKGAWLVMLLHALGHRVSGFALDPLPGTVFTTAQVGDLLEMDVRADIRDPSAVREAMEAVRPDVVIHLAAQAIVRESYRDPARTVETNVIGTMNVVEASRLVDSVRAQLIITTDKVYRNVGRVEGYREDEPLGAADPYSTSKAMADLLVQSWARSFDGPPTATARGGNVIGGGDNAADRLLPDLIRAFVDGRTARLRFPEAVRPWQHVLDCLDGYLTIVDALLDGRGTGEWNIGPGAESFVTVGKVADHVAQRWGEDAAWEQESVPQPAEAGLLAIDPDKARRELNWTSRLLYPESVDWTIDWERAVHAGDDPRVAAERQISHYLDRCNR